MTWRRGLSRNAFVVPCPPTRHLMRTSGEVRGAYDDELLAGGEVGDAEVHLRTLRVMGEVGQDQVDLVRRQQRDAVGRVGRQHCSRTPSLSARALGIVDVEAFDLLALASTKPNGRLPSKDATRITPALRMVLRAVGLGQAEDQARARR